MEYPIKTEISLIQEDFIEVEILENLLDVKDQKNSALKAFIYQTVICFSAAVALYFFKFAAKESLWLVLAFFLMFLANFCFKYFYGIKNEFNMAIAHLINADKEGKNFFAPEQGFVNFYMDKCEYLTNENRRYFNYSNIKNIKITKRLFIFVMKISKEKSIRGFFYMIIPKRDLTPRQTENLEILCQKITREYNLLPWIQNTVFD